MLWVSHDEGTASLVQHTATRLQQQGAIGITLAPPCVSLNVTCCRLLVTPLAVPPLCRVPAGDAAAPACAGLLDALVQRDQQQHEAMLKLQTQMQLLHSYSYQLQTLADRAVKTAVAGTAGLKDLPKQQQRALQHSDSSNARSKAAAAAGRGGVFAGSQQQGQVTPDAPNGISLAGGFGSQAPAGIGSQAPPLWSTQQPAPLQQPQQFMRPPGAGAGGGGGSGGASRAGGAVSGGGRAHLARQSQDELALRQLWAEQQGLSSEWEQHVQPLLSHQGPLDSYLQLAQKAGRAGDSVVGAAGGMRRNETAQPWHLGQLPAEQQQLAGDAGGVLRDASGDEKQQELQQEGGSLTQSGVPLGLNKPPLANGPSGGSASLFTAAAATAAGPSSQLGAAAGADVSMAVVAPAKQKQAAGHKRKAREGGGLLTRGRR